MEDLTGLGKLADSKLVNKAYDDALTEPMKETSKLLTDAVKAFRLFVAPIQLLAVAQDRLAAFCERVRQRVPEERQQEAAPSVAIPVLLSLRYMEDENPLTELFLNLLARAIDKERCGEAHPAFVRVIEQLCPDEAMVMHVLRDRVVSVNRESGWSDFPMDRLTYPDSLLMYFSHLGSLSLLVDPMTVPMVFAIDENSSPMIDVEVTRFGRLFIKACVPPSSES